MINVIRRVPVGERIRSNQVLSGKYKGGERVRREGGRMHTQGLVKIHCWP